MQLRKAYVDCLSCSYFLGYLKSCVNLIPKYASLQWTPKQVSFYFHKFNELVRTYLLFVITLSNWAESQHGFRSCQWNMFRPRDCDCMYLFSLIRIKAHKIMQHQGNIQPVRMALKQNSYNKYTSFSIIKQFKMKIQLNYPFSGGY